MKKMNMLYKQRSQQMHRTKNVCTAALSLGIYLAHEQEDETPSGDGANNNKKKMALTKKGQ
jgi:hypothetical protein